jgi:sucrose-6-phosphate hydrolase SacC (GH32 family)
VPAADLIFLATYFLGNGEAGAYLATSDDGYNFRPLSEPNVAILKPAVGPDRLMRDPCLIKGPDHEWHLVWTTGWWDNGIGIAHSKDLVHWSEQKMLPVMTQFPGTLNAWAPEIVYDAQQKRYVIFWSSTIPGLFPETIRLDGDLGRNREPLNHRYYFTTTRDFKTYEPSKLLWNPGFNCIDATLLQRENAWLLFGKDETKAPAPHKFLFMAKAPAVAGPYTVTAPRLTGSYWSEGPTAVDLGDRVRVYFDRYMEDRWGAVESKDLLHWDDVSEKIHMIPHARHGSVQRIDSRELAAIRSHLGA